MLKYKLFIIIVLISGLAAPAQSNLSGMVSYKASYAKNYIKKDLKDKKEGKEGANELIKNSSDVYATLKFNSEGSSYRVDEKLQVDNIESINITYFSAGSNHLYYHNKDWLNILQSNETLGKRFLIKRKSPNWNITKETKMIDDLLCIKAYSTISENNKEKAGPTAWFSPSIPVNYGPMQYFGLPGLIIELQFGSVTFIAKKISLNKDHVIVEKPQEAPIVTPEEFMAIAKKKTPDFFEN